MIFEKLRALIADHTDCDEDAVKMETTFLDLGIDSLDTVEMIMDLEDELGVELEFDEKVTTVGELVAFIEKRLKEKADA